MSNGLHSLYISIFVYVDIDILWYNLSKMERDYKMKKKNYLKKRGFTLIELLAVIAIIVIILLVI